MKVSLVVVCHFSAAVVDRCLESFRQQAATAGLDAEVVAVEQSEDDEQRAAVEAYRPDTLLIRPNRGYAAGLNSGLEHATGDTIILANPDLTFLDGSVAAVADALGTGADVVGPQLVWDDDGQVILPIPDDPSPLAELGRTLRRRRRSAPDIARVLDFSWRVWTATDPVEVPSLRGPAMAMARSTADRLGPLDEGYFLYYEETDWLLRARRAGARIALQPAARVAHRWGHATARRADRSEVEARSRARFFARCYPWWARRSLAALAPADAPAEIGFSPIDGPAALPETPASVWLLSVTATMEPSAGCLGGSGLPPAAHELTSHGRWYAVAARRAGRRWRILGAWMWGQR